MPTTVRGHEFERDAHRAFRVRDMATYRCTRCGTTAQVGTRLRGNLAEMLSGKVRSDCTGVMPAPRPPPPERPFEGGTPMTVPEGRIFSVPFTYGRDPED